MNTPDVHRSIKNALKNIIKDQATQYIILDVVGACHRLTVHALQFLKLFLLTSYEQGVPLQEVTEHLVVTIMKVLCEESNGSETKTKGCKETTLHLKQELRLFHQQHYKPTMIDNQEKLGFTNMTQLLQYIAGCQGLREQYQTPLCATFEPVS